MSKQETLVYKLENTIDHPNSDNLKIFKINGYQVIFNKNDFKEGDLIAYIEPDTIVPDNEQFKFLQGHTRIKSRKLRGLYSEGLLIKAPENTRVGDDIWELLGVTRYEPPVDINMGGEDESGPPGNWPHYDVENYKKYNTLILSGEEIIISEKLNGCNSLYVWLNDRLWVRSRNHWKKGDEKNLYWKTLLYNAWIESFCQHHEGCGLFGEIYGQVGGWPYGSINRSPQFAIFDVYYKNQWLNYDDAKKLTKGCMWCPEIYRGPWKENCKLEEGNSLIMGANHIKEGIVIQPVINRFDEKIGRVKLKLINNEYLQKD